MELPTPAAEAVVLQERAPLLNGAAHLSERGIELAADAFGAALTDYLLARLRLSAVTAHALAFRIPGSK